VIRRRRGARTLVVGLVVAAITAGGTAAATSTFWWNLRARLAPAAGTKEAGQFQGALVKLGGGVTPDAITSAAAGSRWGLTWKLTLPALDGPVRATLRIGSEPGSTSVTRVLCTRCSTTASGTMTLTARQARRLSKADAVVVVRSRSARLRGSVKVGLQNPVVGKAQRER
jgi:hypothetical protein